MTKPQSPNTGQCPSTQDRSNRPGVLVTRTWSFLGHSSLVVRHLVFSLAALVLLGAIIGLTAPMEQARAVPPSPTCIHAVVRIASHGGSATIIASQAGKSYLLTCSHCFGGEEAAIPIQLDVPSSKSRGRSPARCRLLDIDYAIDLALLELDDGPLDYVAPVAAADSIPGRDLVSVGYDEMQTPATVQRATIVSQSADRTFTREKPWHGRSGGALLDLNSGRLIGVVQGYEVRPGGRGIYAGLGAILRFLRRQHHHGKPLGPDRPSLKLAPEIMPYAGPL